MTRAWALIASVSVAGCSPSPCQRVCTKLASCSIVASESQCQADCQKPPDNGAPCNNEDTIAACIEGETCAQLTDVTSNAICPLCD